MDYLYWVSCIVGIGCILYTGHSGRIGKMIRQVLNDKKPYAHISTPADLWRESKAYKTYTINFPDGIVTTYKEFANIPDYTTWTEPMMELFLLMVKDWRNWSYTCNCDIWDNLKEVFSHENTGVAIKKLSWVVNMENINGGCYRKYCHRYDHDLLNTYEIKAVVALAEVWRQVHYGDKLARIERINTLRSARIRQEEETKREELAKLARAAEAQKIRDYLDGIYK